MARIEGIRIQNFGALRDVTLGKLWNTQAAQPLSPITVVIGKNGAGKSTLFDAFGYLADCLSGGVEKACDSRGGYTRIRSQGATEPIAFEVYYRQDSRARPITYEVEIDLDRSGRPFVARERLRQRRRGQNRGHPFSFLILNNGAGAVWNGDALGLDLADDPWVDASSLLLTALSEQDEEAPHREPVELSDRRHLGIATLGSLMRHPRISAFRTFVEQWYLSYFSPDAARSLPLAGPQPHLNKHGDNLGNVVQYYMREYPDRFDAILRSIALKIPGIQSIDTLPTEDGRLLLRFNDRGFADPFYARQMSDGTLKLFAYLLLLQDPFPPPFIGIEEPENGLYHQLLDTLVTEFRLHSKRVRNSSQIFITTHQPYLVDALKPDEVWIVEKGDDGFSTVRRASDDHVVVSMVEEGLPLGALWYSDYLERH